jgi:hypothetical protein
VTHCLEPSCERPTLTLTQEGYSPVAVCALHLPKELRIRGAEMVIVSPDLKVVVAI